MSYFRLFFIAIFFVSLSTSAAAQIKKFEKIREKLIKFEKKFNGKIGVYAINTNNGQTFAYRAQQLFPMQSTFKLIAVAVFLQQSEYHQNLLQEKLYYTKNDLVTWHPITSKHIVQGMTLSALAEAAMRYSDNPAINLIIKRLGGLNSINTFAHSIGNQSFNLKHYESDLNSNPNNYDDTVTPQNMAMSLKKLTLGTTLSSTRRMQLIAWMTGNITGKEGIRAGVPKSWLVADKTGSGSYGVRNDIGIVWPPHAKPIVIVIYTVQNKRDAKPCNNLIATVTHLVITDASFIK